MSFAELATLPQDDPRKAALLLHSMAPVDRAWLLERMPDSAREVLRLLLDELAELDIPPDAHWVGRLLDMPDACTDGAAAAPPGAGSGDADFLMDIGADGIRALAQAWIGQPPRLVARALCLQPWPWRPQLLGQLPLAQRRSVMDLLESMPLDAVRDNAMAKALMAAMRQACERPPEGSGAHAGHKPPARWLLVGMRMPWRRKES